MNFFNGYQNPLDNSFIGFYVTDYKEVLNYAVPQNGKASVFVDLDQGLLWSKKVVDGLPYIQPYKLSPLYTEGQVQPQVTTTDQKLDKLIELLSRSNRNELNNDHEPVNAEIKSTKSTGL